MKKFIILLIIIFLAFAAPVFGEEEEHTEIVLMDKDGNELLEPGAPVSADVTCGECHEADEINSHMAHIKNGVRADCISCHFKGGKMEGDYAEAHLRIQRPAAENCLTCHGIGSTGKDPVTIPADYLETPDYTPGKKYYGITQHTGVILSPQHIAQSGLNIAGKKDLNVAWDVHARLRMDCIYCHHSEGKGAYFARLKAPPAHMAPTPATPEEKKEDAEEAAEPNHDLRKASCTACHNPEAAHVNLPHREKHMERLSCQSCHVSAIYGPAFKTEDYTVIRPDGAARVELQGVDETAGHGASLNTKFYRGYIPSLFRHDDGNGGVRFSPFNLVTRWAWKSGKTGEPVPADVLKKAFLDPASGGFADDVVTAFDNNGDKQVDASELVLDTDEKTGFIKQKLAALGVAGPVIAGTVAAHRVKHGMVHVSKMKWSCSNCHGKDSRFGADVVLAGAAPGGAIPVLEKDSMAMLDGEISLAENGSVVLKRSAAGPGFYILGFSGIRWLDGLGVWIFLLTVIVIFGFAGLRFVHALKQPAAEVKTRDEFRYGVFEQLWHWALAAIAVLTALTGLQIHFAGSFNLFGLDYAVSLHDILAVVLAVNAGLGLLYHLFTGKIKEFFTVNGALFNAKPNRLLKRTYIMLLNVLVPVLAITGALTWFMPQWHGVLGPIHSFAAWLFLSFLAVHLALAFGGVTLSANFRAMFTGYAVVAESGADEEPVTLRDLRILDFTGAVIGKFTRGE